ncbi:hypothetical protein BaRGS_00026805, partial [Batillaria attramentaria]
SSIAGLECRSSVAALESRSSVAGLESRSSVADLWGSNAGYPDTGGSVTHSQALKEVHGLAENAVAAAVKRNRLILRFLSKAPAPDDIMAGFTGHRNSLGSGLGGSCVRYPSH